MYIKELEEKKQKYRDIQDWINEFSGRTVKQTYKLKVHTLIKAFKSIEIMEEETTINYIYCNPSCPSIEIYAYVCYRNCWIGVFGVCLS